MNDLIKNHKNKSPILITDLFRKLDDDKFFIDSDCVFTNNNILVKNRVYDIIDFLDNGGINQYHVKMLHAYLKGFYFIFVGIDLLTGEFMYRRHRLDARMLACDWLVVDLDFFDNEINEYFIRFASKKKILLNDTSHE